MAMTTETRMSKTEQEYVRKLNHMAESLKRIHGETAPERLEVYTVLISATASGARTVNLYGIAARANETPHLVCLVAEMRISNGNREHWATIEAARLAWDLTENEADAITYCRNI